MNNLLTLSPTSTQEKMPLLIALHGNLSSAEAELDQWRPAVSAGWMLAMPQSTRMDEDGKFIWNQPGANAWPVAEIQTHYANLLEQYPIDTERVIIAGFSMGAGLAAWTTLHGFVKARGFIMVSPYLPYKYVEAPEMDIVTPNQFRGYVIAGGLDEPTFEWSGKFVERVRKHNIPCELATYPNMDHEYPSDFDNVLLHALNFITKRNSKESNS